MSPFCAEGDISEVSLVEDRKLAAGAVVHEIAAIRFFYRRVLKRRDMNKDLP